MRFILLVMLVASAPLMADDSYESQQIIDRNDRIKSEGQYYDNLANSYLKSDSSKQDQEQQNTNYQPNYGSSYNSGPLGHEHLGDGLSLGHGR